MYNAEFAIEDRFAEQQRHAENSARLATAWGRYKSNGQGSIEFAKQTKFGLTFIEEPTVSYGAHLDLDELSDLIGHDPSNPKTPILPLCSGFVTDWNIDDRGFYVGAWMAVRVYYPAEDLVDAKLMVPMIHHFRFDAIALKDVPLDVRD